MKVQRTGRIRAAAEVGPGFHRLDLNLDLDGLALEPGQFCFVKPVHGAGYLLRRPFGVAAADERGISLLFDVRGVGTADLASRGPGEAIDVLLPLGRGFPAPPPGHTPVLVAGGCGLAPLYFLAQRLAAQGRAFRFIFGAACAGKLVLRDEIRALCPKAAFTTDDGSYGLRGLVSAALPLDERPAVYYACGPTAMMQAVARAVVGSGHDCYVSLEEFMACGLGVCNGCAVELRAVDGRRRTARACVEGPVFAAKELAWDLG